MYMLSYARNTKKIAKQEDNHFNIILSPFQIRPFQYQFKAIWKSFQGHFNCNLRPFQKYPKVSSKSFQYQFKVISSSKLISNHFKLISNPKPLETLKGFELGFCFLLLKTLHLKGLNQVLTHRVKPQKISSWVETTP